MVTLISSPADLPADAPPGLVVLVTDEPSAAAGAVAEVLDAPAVCSPSEAAADLDGRLAAAGAGGDAGMEARAQRDAALALARHEADEALARVPPAARGVAPARVNAAAAAVRTAKEAATDARAVLGERPELAVDAAQAVLAAAEAVARAEEHRAIGVERSVTLLLAANAVGILIIAGRVRTAAVEPIFVLVAACPLTALLHLATTVVSRTRQARAAARLRTQALRATGMATVAGLVARHARLKAWTARAEALAAAEASLAQARRRWDAVAGSSTHPSAAAALVTAMADADRAAAAVAELEAQPIDPVPEPARALVVIVEGPTDRVLDDETRQLLERLDDGVDPAAAVVVTACSEIGSWAEARIADPPVGDGAGQVVDLRERVQSSLDRLRARSAMFRDTTPPSPMAADG